MNDLLTESIDKLEQRERELHDKLVEETQQLRMARARVQAYERALQQTLTELNNVRSELDTKRTRLRTMWDTAR